MAHGKLGGGAEAPPDRVEGGPPLVQGLFQQRGVRLCRWRGLCLEIGQHLLPLGHEPVPVGLPGPADGGQQLEQPRQTPAAVLGKVGTGKEGDLVRREKDGGGPAAAPGEGLADGHAQAVNVRALLPVHLDGDKALVEQFRHLRVLEALPCHHVAPVAGAVAHAEKDGLVLLPGPLEGLLTPGVPVHRVVSVLAEIGAGLVLEMIGHSITSFFLMFPLVCEESRRNIELRRLFCGIILVLDETFSSRISISRWSAPFSAWQSGEGSFPGAG